MSEFEISADWIAQEGRNEADATLSEMLIVVDDRIVSEFADRKGAVSKKLQIPAYFLAEWMAENWWPLLWEPRKSEDEGDDSEFLSRHSFLTAQHGFALPKLSIVALGKSLDITASARDATLAGVRFKNRAQIACGRELVEGTIRGFVQSVVDRLEERRVRDTSLQDLWKLINETDEEEAQFCRFAGALGLSPYDIDDRIAGLLEQLLPQFGERLLMDLCLASPAAQFPVVAAIAEQAMEITRGAASSTLSPIESVLLPKENLSLPAWRRGIQAAELLRRRLGISDLDTKGASRIFDLFKIDTKVQTRTNHTYDEVVVTGAVVRNENEMKVGLLQEKETKRRFAGARAIFSAWSSEGLTETRLLTSAVTRDQQANRAFAAELTAPKALIRSRVKKGRLTMTEVFDLAADLQIGPDVILKQANNNGVLVPRV
ncbi:hypothetical protein LJR220_003311 [Bradyrhizobium sp. LjRoot220]|uniref:hypothetical protein n=1 Tax=Bradyrhizobium sp. LjRoot220 TaxID=3342284 RepID=UPI003ECE3554